MNEWKTLSTNCERKETEDNKKYNSCFVCLPEQPEKSVADCLAAWTGSVDGGILAIFVFPFFSSVFSYSSSSSQYVGYLTMTFLLLPAKIERQQWG